MKTKKRLFLLAALMVTMLTSSMSMTAYAGQATRGCSSSHSASSLTVVPGTYLGSCDSCGSSVYVRKCSSCGYMATVCSNGHFQ